MIRSLTILLIIISSQIYLPLVQGQKQGPRIEKWPEHGFYKLILGKQRQETFTTIPTIVHFVSRKAVQQELAVADYQIAEINKLKKEVFDEVGDIIDDWLIDAKSDAKFPTDALRTSIEKKTIWFENHVRTKVLLSHQVALIDKYPLFLAIRKYGLFKMIAYGPIGHQIELADEQRKKLEEKAGEIRSELAKRIHKLEKEAIKNLLTDLDPKQRKAVMEIYNTFNKTTKPNLNQLLMHLDATNLSDCDARDRSLIEKSRNSTSEKSRQSKSVLDKEPH